MNASYEWLRAFVDFDATPSQLRELLTTHTAVVEDLVPVRTDLAPIVVARVIEAGRHPDSDHLWLTKVDAGGTQSLEVVCGAPNVTVGALYPFAQVGVTMPNGIKIERRKIRGIYSNGMLCSARELGLGDDQAGILELNVDAAPGTPFLSAMVVGDTRLVLDIGANRPDLLSHLGVARELTVITGTPWHFPEIAGLGATTAAPRLAKERGATGGIDVRVESDSATRRYMGAVIRGVRIGPSPEWLRRRLETVGVRSINNVVDATNYVLHELGQPVHAFDLARLQGPLVVRRAKAKEKVVTLDGVVRELPADAVIIADARRAQAIAGVMGGRESEVTDATTDLFVEVASFDPVLTRRGRRGLGLSTDASYRFERGVDAELSPIGMDRVVRLILSLAGGTLVDAPIDIVQEIPPQRAVVLRAARARQVLGADVPWDRARRYLEGAGFTIDGASDRELRVRVPTWRADVEGEIDLVEEVARFHGYDKFPDEIRAFRPTNTFDDPRWTTASRVREALVGLGLLEIRPMPFVSGGDETHVRIANPLADNEAYLRHSLMETLTKRAEYNLAQRVGDVRIFEIGSVFSPGTQSMPREQVRVGILVMGRRRPTHFSEPQPPAYDEWDAKALAEVAAGAVHRDAQPSLDAGSDDVLWTIRVGERAIGKVTRVALDAPVWAAPAFGVEIVLGEMETAPAAERGKHAYAYIEGPKGSPRVSARYQPLPTQPAVENDVALLVPEGVTVSDVERVIRDSAGDLLEALVLFDQYAGEGIPPGHRSLAWRLTFRHPERTLRDKEIEARRGRIIDALQEELHVRQRTA